MQKSYLLTLAGAAMLFVSSTASAAAPGGREFYGYNLGSAEFADGVKTYDCGFVSYPFDLSENGTILKSYLDRATTGVYAGAGVEGILYVCEYEFLSSMQEPTPTDLVSYNIFDGTRQVIGQWNPAGSGFKPSDMTYDPTTGKVYAVGYDYGTALYEVNLSTAEFTKICNMSSGALIAADPKGQLYTMDTAGVLYTVDPSNGRMVKVFSTGLSGMMQNQTMEFDRTTGKLYWAANVSGHREGAENVWLQEIDLSDPSNITITEVGQVGILSRFVSMYIPYADNLEAPAAPTDVTSTPAADGSFAATISWTNPTTAFGGGEIGSVYGAVIKRDGETVATIDNVVPGERMSWTDSNIPSKGYYRYDIQVYNAKGNGAKGTAFQFVGPDKPGQVKNILGDVAENMKSIVLTWEAPTAGASLGAFNPADVKYTVIRNDNTVIAENISECTATDDDFVRLMGYTYTVRAINEEGYSDTESGSWILGPAQKFPLEQTFENEAQVRNRWTVLDANADTFSWMFNTTLGQSLFGDFESCAEYIVSPTLGIENGADEWLISPPMAMEANEEYELTISGRSYSSANGVAFSDELIDVHFGNTNTIEALSQKLGTLRVRANGMDEATSTMAFVRSSILLPVQSEDAVRCVGLHLVSPLYRTGFLQINGIYLGTKGQYSNGIADVAVDSSDVTFSLNGRNLAIVGAFETAELYDLSGVRVAACQALTDLSDLNAGIYVLRVDARSFKIALN